MEGLSGMETAVGSRLPFADNRPEAIAQRKLQSAANNSPQVRQLKAVQAKATDSDQVRETAQLQSKVQPLQRQPNNTGLPDNLKSGLESMSGYSMDDVKVHYNSDKPAQLQAHAYAEGSNIHVSPGQEKHVAHEAWHVVQQKQGRVQPTMQLKGAAINDDAGLEREADVMGAKALQMKVSNDAPVQGPKRNAKVVSQRMPIQRVLRPVVQRSVMNESDATFDAASDSPFTALQKELPSVNLFLSSANAANIHDPSGAQTTYKRPKEVKATIVGARRPKGARPPSGVPAAVGNLGDQELLIRHGIRQPTFQGGHLIGDELLPLTIDSMVDWNLAPQHGDFNHPVYFGLAEELICHGAINPSTGHPDTSIPIDVVVQLDYYSATFDIDVQDLINHGVVAATDISTAGISTTKTITLVQRIPKQWKIGATINSTMAATFEHHALTSNQQSAFHGAAPALGPTDYSVSSPDLSTIHGSTMIGGGSSLSLTGLHGNPDLSNTNPSLVGSAPVLSAPAVVPAPLFSTPLDINTELDSHNGELPASHLGVLKSIPGVAKTHIGIVKSKSKRRWLNRRAKSLKAFKDHEDLIAFLQGELPSSAAGKVLLMRLRMDRSIKY